MVTASNDSHPDLFWALRGAGAGIMGLVVEMTIDLFSVTEVYAWHLLYPLADAADVFDFDARWSERLPEEMTTSFLIMPFPPMEIVPEPLRGNSYAIVRGCHSGDPVEAAEFVDQVRNWRQPAMDVFGPMPFQPVGPDLQRSRRPAGRPASITMSSRH